MQQKIENPDFNIFLNISLQDTNISILLQLYECHGQVNAKTYSIFLLFKWREIILLTHHTMMKHHINKEIKELTRHMSRSLAHFNKQSHIPTEETLP